MISHLMLSLVLHEKPNLDLVGKKTSGIKVAFHFVGRLFHLKGEIPPTATETPEHIHDPLRSKPESLP